MFLFQTPFGQRLLLCQHFRIMTAVLPFVIFTPFSFESTPQLLPELLIPFTDAGIRYHQHRQQLCSRISKWPLLSGRRGLSTQDPGSPSTGTAPLLSVLYLGLLSRILFEQGVLKLRSLKATGLMQEPFSTDEETEAKAFNSWPDPFPLFQERQPSSSSKMSLYLCCASVSASLHEHSNFYLAGLFQELNQTQ